MPDERIYANGINGLTGEYLLEPVPPSDFTVNIREDEDPETAEQLAQLVSDEAHYGPPFHLDPTVVSEVGWAVVVSVEEDAEVRAAIEPLIQHRRTQAGAAMTKVLDHRPGEGWRDWLGRHGTGPGNIDPDRVPYYVLIVGSPARIPFSFQYLLDVEYAVGRIDFDEPAGYRRYVGALVEHEANAATRDRSATFFGTRHAFDKATQLSADLLVTPLAQSFQPGGQFHDAVSSAYRIDCMLGDAATKDELKSIFAGTSTCGRPGLFFSATHGMGGWPANHPEQTARHGALLCQDWPGVGQIGAEQYFAGSDLGAQPQVAGMMAFFFACYGAGTPNVDAFHHKGGQPPPTIAHRPFVARLPMAMLEAGALAVVGHVERAWGYSFVAAGQAQLVPFQNAVGRVLSHQPIGFAMKDFNERYAALSAAISDVLEKLSFGKLIPDAELARLWTERNDAQNYVVLGDPAATLQTA